MQRCERMFNCEIFVQVRNGHIKRITDNDIQSLVLEIVGTNVSTTFITCPADPKKTLGIKLPFLVMIIKNLKKYFTFEVQVLDDKNVRRRFRASNYQSTTRVKPFICTMPMRLDDGWNQIQFNLSDFTRRAYGTNYIETLRVQVNIFRWKTKKNKNKTSFPECESYSKWLVLFCNVDSCQLSHSTSVLLG